MKNALLFRLICFSCCWSGFLFSTEIPAQGSWNPPGAQPVFPRTIVSAADLPALRDSLANTGRLQMFTSLYNQALIAAPANNTTSNNRRSRAAQAKNAAFVAQLNRMPAAGSVVVLPAAQFHQITTKSRNLLQTINTNVEDVFQYTEWQWRSKELIDYLIAYDLLRGAGIPADSLVAEKARLQEFAANLYNAATSNPLFYTLAKNNHALMTSAALGMAAVVLNDAGSATAAAQPQNWINTAMYTMDNVLWRDAFGQSDPDTIVGYAEGPYYFKYAFQNLLPFFKAMGNFLPDVSLNYTYNNDTRNIRNPYFDPTYDLLYTWITAITMPDGRLPALEDSFTDMAMPELVLTGKSRYVKPLWLQNVNPLQNNSLSEMLNVTVDFRAAWLGSLVQPTPHADTLVNLPESGNLIFRNSAGPGSGYLHLYGKHGRALDNSGGHNQGDAASFLLYSHGQLLALDPGYLSFDQRALLGNATNHNLILVDGAGPLIGATGNANDAQAYIRNGFQIPELQYGEVATAYSGAGILRKAMAVRGKYYTIADQINAPQQHSYTWQLHGYGLGNGTPATGTFTSGFNNKSASWQKNGVTLKADVNTTATASFSAVTAQHELVYNTTEDHTAMLVTQTALSAGFLSVLQPHVSQALPLAHYQQGGMAVSVVSDSLYHDLFIVKTDSSLQQPGNPNSGVQTNAMFTFLSRNSAGDIRQAVLQNGSVLLLDNELIAQTDNRATIAWTQTHPDSVFGYITGAANLHLHTIRYPAAVFGAGVNSWSYNTTTDKTVISFSGAGHFQITLSDTLLSAKPAVASIEVSVFPNPFSSEINVIADGFAAGEKVMLTLTDITGRIVFRNLAEAKNGLLQTKIQPLQALPNGLYLLKLQGANGKNAIRKIVSR